MELLVLGKHFEISHIFAQLNDGFSKRIEHNNRSFWSHLQKLSFENLIIRFTEVKSRVWSGWLSHLPVCISCLLEEPAVTYVSCSLLLVEYPRSSGFTFNSPILPGPIWLLIFSWKLNDVISHLNQAPF